LKTGKLLVHSKNPRILHLRNQISASDCTNADASDGKVPPSKGQLGQVNGLSFYHEDFVFEHDPFGQSFAANSSFS